MAISAKMVKELREMTGAGMMDCKKALTATDGDMDKAVERIEQAVEKQEQITIYGDYDADGLFYGGDIKKAYQIKDIPAKYFSEIALQVERATAQAQGISGK